MTRVSAVKHWTAKNKPPLIIIGVVALLVSIYFASPMLIGAINESRVQYAKPVGQLVIGSQPSQQLAIVKYVVQRDASAGMTTICSATVFGYDALYIYGYTMCEQKDAKGVLLSSGTDYGRYAYNGPIYHPVVTKMEIQGNDNEPALEGLYPAAIYHIAMPNVRH